MTVLRRRLLGLVFFIIVALFFTVTIMKFNNSFTDYTEVTLKTDSTGNALPSNADVKARGVVVGEVRRVEPAPDGSVDVILGLTPSMADELPASTTARILPKTLFGERYVALQVPETTGGPTLTNGASIATDTSGNAREVQELFDKLLPVLEAIPPQDLNVTLTSLSSALSGRGEQIGTTLDELNTIFARINEHMPELQGTLRGLASFSQTYSEALPDVIDALDNLRTTSNTIVERQGDLRTLISTLGVAATDTTGWLRQNRTDLIDLFVDSEPFLVGLAKQSPTFVCTFRNFAGLIPESRRIVGQGTKNPGVRVNLQFVNPRGRYLPNQDEPRLLDRDPPAVCYEPARDGRPFPQYPGGGLADGSYQPPSRNAGPRTVKTLPQPQFSGMPAGTVRSNPYDDPDYVNQLKVIYGATSGVDPKDVPSWVTMIGGATLQGAQVDIK
ncbi:virulence factor Mce family protein [Gordonia bronchialis DSM 43247]|uniref:Virulence factor Mce family protein n=1 Tax=Gordonia bronchialis (strain ATCC 25592 / DSM 43247 / BCRC 13721 / JCM 3198 / KCTC 3076 / NBRC 16047 / NCTC 10667) TaxID=526226 RepID=D0L4Y6_GORB4|nr:MCE family protein [Gordonia bronchialis]ACY20438.1 virulence factor Mce family protein [Gordonia bronchialis DSM 43247]MCC3323214.1 MCE family protein [Gordonia bronchialis]QGS25767.1 MCE family protein [Gordonia bronchialis]UAK37835.1 MCE family protein [Gordonia bronchialis]STQ63243.1 virulence factor Mce family protein [Gordonia bronchialis]